MIVCAVGSEREQEPAGSTGGHLDFKNALAEGFLRVFPKATICGDFFHLMQANVKKICQLHLQVIKTCLVNGVRELFYAPTKREFDITLENFLKDMDECAPAYAAYFCHTWLDHHPPEKWASFARPVRAPRGIFLLLFFFFCDRAEATTVNWRKLCPITHYLQTRWSISWPVRMITGSALWVTRSSGWRRRSSTAQHRCIIKRGGTPSPPTLP
jgi:hypothetical protein